MKGSVVLAIFICFFYKTWSYNIPSKTNLCGLIVDNSFQLECLECFTNAGHISVNPEGVRECVATYLPPLVAKCAVPHPDSDRQIDRIQQVTPSTHHNHTNANLLPNCLKRRMRELSRYLEQENNFAMQAGKIVKIVVTSNLIPLGGPNMLGAFSQRYILELPGIKNLVAQSASQCLDDHDSSNGSGENSDEAEDNDLDEDSDEDDDLDEDLDEDYDLDEDSDEDSAEDDDGDSRNEDSEDAEDLWRALKSGPEWEDSKEFHLKSRFSDKGNGLPYGGTNSLSRDMILGKCIIDSLIANNQTVDLIQIISQDEFYYPIPSWWVEPLLRFYQEYRQNLENDSRG